jgi:hypothetical protein
MSAIEQHVKGRDRLWAKSEEVGAVLIGETEMAIQFYDAPPGAGAESVRLPLLYFGHFVA